MNIDTIKAAVSRIVATTEEWGSTTYLMDATAHIPTVREFWVGQCGMTEDELYGDFIRDKFGYSAEDCDEYRAAFAEYVESEMPVTPGEEFFSYEIEDIADAGDDESDIRFYVEKLVSSIRKYDNDCQGLIDDVCAKISEAV